MVGDAAAGRGGDGRPDDGRAATASRGCLGPCCRRGPGSRSRRCSAPERTTFSMSVIRESSLWHDAARGPDPADRAVLESLIPAILEQKVTGTEAHRAYHGLVWRYGEPAPGPVELGLRVMPGSTTLAALPYWAYHPLGVERRRADLIRAILGRPPPSNGWSTVRWPTPTGGFDRSRDRTVDGRRGRRPGAGRCRRQRRRFPPAASGGLRTGRRTARDRRAHGRVARPFRDGALVVRLLELSGVQAPRYGPRLAPRRIEGI